MKKSKFLLLITIILILLIALALVTQNTKDTVAADSSDTTPLVTNQSNIEVTNYTKDDLQQIEITEGENNLTFIKDGQNWGIDGIDSSDNLDTSAIKMLCDNLLTLDASKQIEATNLEDFGLTKPSKIITYTLVDGATSRILFGSTTPDNKSVYTLKADTKEVFLITSSMVNSFTGNLTNFRTTELDTIDVSTVTALKASGKNIDTFDISLNTDTQAYTTSYLLKLEDGSIRDMSTTNFLELLKLIPSPITIENFVADHVTDLAPYGLDVPTLDLYIQNTTTDTTSDETKEITTEIHYLWGNTTDDGQVYFMKAGSPNVYSMNSNFLASLLDSFDIFNLSAKFIQLTNIADVMQIDIKLPDSNYTLQIDGENYTLNEESLSEDTFKAVYKNIIGICADSELTDATLPSTNPIISFTFTSPEGEKTTYNYYAYDKQFYLTQFKGQSMVGCSIKQFNYLKECLDKALIEK